MSLYGLYVRFDKENAVVILILIFIDFLSLISVRVRFGRLVNFSEIDDLLIDADFVEEKRRNSARIQIFFIVVSIGQLHKGKGVLDFIKLAKENQDIKFLWIGGFNFGKCMDGYKEIKKVYDNPYPNIKFTGVIDRDEVNILTNIADVFFLPSY